VTGRSQCMSDMTTQLIITPLHRHTQVCCSCRRKHSNQMIFILPLFWSPYWLLWSFVFSCLGSHDGRRRGSSKHPNPSGALRRHFPVSWHLYHAPFNSYVHAIIYLLRIALRCRCFLSLPFDTTRHYPLLPRSFVVTCQKNNHNNKCNNHSTKLVMA